MKQESGKSCQGAMTLAMSGVLLALLSGCGGSGGKGANTAPTPAGEKGTIQNYGSVTTRVVGTAQSPISVAGVNATVTGVAGATISEMTESHPKSSSSVTAPRIIWSGYRNGNYEILSKSSDGAGTEANLTNDSNDDVEPQLSPDGKKIVWRRNLSANTMIIVKNADGSGSEINLTPSNFENYHPQWSPDSKKVVWQARRGTDSAILVKNADGSGNEVTIASHYYYNVVTMDKNPQWSPDGAKITWASSGGIWVGNADGSGTAHAITLPANINDHPQWSPDGGKIAYESVRGNFTKVAVQSAATVGNELIIAPGNTDEKQPQWSPDGKKLVFQGNRHGLEILVKNADDSGTETQLTNNIYSDSSPQWSSDGAKIAWEGIRGSTEIFIKNADGSGMELNISNDSGDDIGPEWASVAAVKSGGRKLIGAGGLLGTAAAGFLVSQTGDTVASLVAFDSGAPTNASRSLVRLTPQSVSQGYSPSNLVFAITAGDSLSSLNLVNGGDTTPTVIIGPTGDVTTASGAIVSFAGNTGQVALVIPYVADRSVGAETPQASAEGDTLIVRGHFAGVWDGSGKNIAAHTVSEVRINGKTGALITAH